MSTTVSVIIPSYNRAHVLGDAIDSVLSQSTPVHELIVIDDGSTDATAELLRRYNSNIIVIQQHNHGVSHARNRGIDRATGEWLAFLDSDDRWFANKIETQLQAITRHPDFRLCHCDEHWIRDGRRVNPMKKHKKRGGHIFEHCLPLCAISPSAVMIHRDLFASVGLFDETLPACEDYDLWLRICCREPVLYVDEALLEKTGGHADQLSRKHWGMDRFRLQALAGILRGNSLDDAQRALAQHTFESKFEIVYRGTLKHQDAAIAARLQADYADLLQ